MVKTAATRKASSAGSARPAKANASPLDDSTGYLVRRTFRAFTRSLEQRVIRHDVSISMWFFLRRLWEEDGLTQKELSRQLGLTQPTTVAAMDNLEQRGLIERRRNTEDRRKTNIHLTAEGRRLSALLIPYATQVNDVALRGLTSQERKNLWDLLQRINTSLDADYSARANARADEG